MNESLQDMMMEATRLTQAGRLQEATDTIQRALLGSASFPTPDAGTPLSPRPAGASSQTPEGRFIAGSHTHKNITRRYKLYIPAGHAGKRMPLVVMLHGCTQDPDDFAAGTGMNQASQALGDKGFLVLYPAQAQDANPQRCWNWFKHTHQQRGRGEPALLASMAQAVAKEYAVDTDRIFVAGLSAGGAMAAIVATAYPELFAAAGVHSGLAPGAAHDLPEALAAMRGGAASVRRQTGTPTIVFHGDQDQTVHPRNADQVIQAMGPSSGTSTIEQGVAAQGRRYTLSLHHDAAGNVAAEHWLIHGAGHAWSGGRAQGSYTDARGPDATAEMLRFFMAHPLTSPR